MTPPAPARITLGTSPFRKGALSPPALSVWGEQKVTRPGVRYTVALRDCPGLPSPPRKGAGTGAEGLGSLLLGLGGRNNLRGEKKAGSWSLRGSEGVAPPLYRSRGNRANSRTATCPNAAGMLTKTSIIRARQQLSPRGSNSPSCPEEGQGLGTDSFPGGARISYSPLQSGNLNGPQNTNCSPHPPCPQLHLSPALPPQPRRPPPQESYRCPSVHTRETAQEWVTGRQVSTLRSGLTLDSQQLPAPRPCCALRETGGQPPHLGACGQGALNSLLPQIVTECQVAARPGQQNTGAPRMSTPCSLRQVRSHRRRGFAGVIQVGVLRRGGDPGLLGARGNNKGPGGGGADGSREWSEVRRDS